LLAISILLAMAASAQTGMPEPAGYSIPTPRPISPAQGTTTPSAQAAQRQNPYLGSVPGKSTGTVLQLSLADANSAAADVHAERLRALAALLPQLSASARQVFDSVNFLELGVRLPSIPGLAPFPSSSGGFGYQDARVAVSQALFDPQLRNRYQARKQDEKASALSTKDARDVVVLAVGTAYFQVIASIARVRTAQAQHASATEFDRLTANRVESEVSPEIESLRAQVERQSTEQRITNVTNQLAKDRLTLARIAGLAIHQEFELTDRPISSGGSPVALGTATAEAWQQRADLVRAVAAVKAAEATRRAERAQRLPTLTFNANYGGGGPNVGNFTQVYEVAGSVSVPIYTGGRIAADIEQAEADLDRRRAEYEDLRGRVAYDVRVAWLDVNASQSSVTVAKKIVPSQDARWSSRRTGI
jgi:outer membrane protein TolC